MTTNLNGSGIRVAQPEADTNGDQLASQSRRVGQPTNLFTYISARLLTYIGWTPPMLSQYLWATESGHADAVAENFYGIPNGVATNVAHVDNYDADLFHQLLRHCSNVPRRASTIRW